MTRTKAILLGLVAILLGSLLVGYGVFTADVASRNLSKDADNFKIARRVVFFNGITDTYLLSIEGLCSIYDEGKQLEVTCKTGKDQYKKHFLGRSDNVTYFVEQLDSAKVSTSHYKVTFKPSVIVPDIEKR